jgi:Flp pilus assembly protein TadG
MTATNLPTKRSGFLTRLMQDQSGNTLAMAAAAVLPIIGIVGGAVDMGRGYMVKSRLQQACDAGALATRKAMAGQTLLDTEKAVGYQYFDFNFPGGLYATANLVRTYTQPSTNATPPVLLPQVNGSASVDMPTALMRVFGKEKLAISVECTAKQDVSHADVAMVLDVTGSMNAQMDKTSDPSGPTESRLSAMRRAVKRFYDTLGPGRAGGDATKGRIRYAVVPYGRTVNTGNLLTHDQMVNSHTYPSRQFSSTTDTFYHWTETSGDTDSAWNWAASTTQTNAIKNTANYASWSDVGSGGGSDYTYTSIFDGSSATTPKTATMIGGSTATSANCYQANTFLAGTDNNTPGLFGAARRNTSTSNVNNSGSAVAPLHPATFRKINDRTARLTTKTRGLRYRWSSSACRLQISDGNSNTDFSGQNVTGMKFRTISWAGPRTANRFLYQQYAIDVSALKKSGGGWNNTLSIPALDASGGSMLTVRRSGVLWSEPTHTGSTAAARTIDWQGCVEERQTDNTITGSTPFTAIPAGAFDLNITIMANASDDRTRWRPHLNKLVYTPEAVRYNDMDDSSDDNDCPAPAFKLQEISSYNADPLDIPFFAGQLLFDDASGGPSAYYYPYAAPTVDNPATADINEANNNNTPSLRNYIDRIRMVPGTIHDPAFVWGMHLVSGQGMFASENSDYFDGTLVSRHIVFMTDGDINPGEEKYTFSGYNMVDGRVAPTNTSDNGMKVIHNRRLRILCQEAKAQGITVWVVVIKDGVSTDTDLRACASSASNFKSAANSDELISSFETIAQSIGGLRLTE